MKTDYNYFTEQDYNFSSGLNRSSVCLYFQNFYLQQERQSNYVTIKTGKLQLAAKSK